MTVDFTYFHVTLKPMSGSAPADGFVDNKSVRDYITYKDSTDNMGSGWPSSADNAIAKARANLRWLHIIQKIETVITPIDIKVIKNEGGSGDQAPTSFEFVVILDRPDSIYIEDPQNPGKQLTGKDALQAYIATALTEYSHRNYMVYLPQNVEKSNSDKGDAPKAHYGESVQFVEVGPLATDVKSAISNVTVEIISGTEPGWYGDYLKKSSSDSSSTSGSSSSSNVSQGE